MKKCPVCGKEFDVLWPDLWAYRENGRFICTWKCLRQLRKEADEKMYTKMKKNGEPAKKSGPKKAAEKVEEVTLVYDPSIAEEYQREQEQKKANEQARAEVLEEMNRPKIFREIEMEPLQICAVRSRAKEGASFMIADNGGMYLSNSTPWLLTKEEWQLFSMEIMVALAQLGIEK